MEFLVSHANYLFIALLIVFTFHLGLISSVKFNDTITSTRFIRDPDTITSNNSDFKLGFFSPANSTNRYVGIWYLSESNVIWVANRDEPLVDSSGVFKIQEDGNLVVLNGQNLVIWSTNVSINATNTTAQLEDSGNFVLQDGTTGATIWATFTHPCDSYIMNNMKISANRITGKRTVFISWKSPFDPSTGYFSGGLARLDAPEVFLWVNKTHPYWRSGPWNGRVYLGIPGMVAEYLVGWALGQDNDGTIYVTFSPSDPSTFGIISLTSHGTLKVATFHNKREVSVVEVKQNKCDIYGTCGPCGSCDALSSPICSCLNGFEPRNSEEWNRKNWTSGCVRKEALQCDKRLLKNASEVVQQDGFLVFHNMKVPDFVERSDGNQDKCRTDCLANCSCLAYAYDSGIGCMHWSGDLIDLQKFSSGGVDLYIRVSHSEQEKNTDTGKESKGSKTLLITAIAGATGSITLVICAYLLWRKWTPKRKGKVAAKTQNSKYY